LAPGGHARGEEGPPAGIQICRRGEEAIAGGGADKSAVASNQANGQISAYITKIEETTRIWSNKKTTNIRKKENRKQRRYVMGDKR
jgi:CelD/BcsL family acetyltransferase involved in cellulose biosynthesis